MKSTSFISTTPLDIIAIFFCAIFLLNCLFFTVIITSVASYWLPVKIEFNVHGYNLLVTKKSFPQTGYRIMIRNGIKIWRYQKLSRLETTEEQLFNF